MFRFFSETFSTAKKLLVFFCDIMRYFLTLCDKAVIEIRKNYMPSLLLDEASRTITDDHWPNRNNESFRKKRLKNWIGIYLANDWMFFKYMFQTISQFLLWAFTKVSISFNEKTSDMRKVWNLLISCRSYFREIFPK